MNISAPICSAAVHKGVNSGVIVGAPLGFVLDHRPHETQFVDRVVQLGDGRLDVLHRDLREAFEVVRILHRHLTHFLIALPVHGGDGLGIRS
jgi:hypothetical protein